MATSFDPSFPNLQQELKTELPGLVDLRHTLHSNPELAFQEHETQKRLETILREAGYTEIKKCAQTGLVVDLKGKGPRRELSPTSPPSPSVVALRGDIDCLPMTEGNHHLPYRSKQPGRAHMCGHDGHTTILAGAALLLKKVDEKLPSNFSVRFLFQPAEEGPGGAKPMIEEGALDNVDEVYGLHNFPLIPLGEISIADGPVAAHLTTLYIDVIGKGGHGSQPQVAVDPILAASHIITSLQSIISRNIHPKEQSVISICQIHAGTTHNVIPDVCSLTGTIRDFDSGVSDLIQQRIIDIAQNTAKSFGATAKVRFEPLYPVLVNSPKETNHMIRVGKKVLGEGKVSSKLLPILGAEDFSYFTEKVPGCFFGLGRGEEGRTNAMCHSTQFDFNDKSIPVGIELWVRLIEDRFGVSLFQ